MILLKEKTSNMNFVENGVMDDVVVGSEVANKKKWYALCPFSFWWRKWELQWGMIFLSQYNKTKFYSCFYLDLFVVFP